MAWRCCAVRDFCAARPFHTFVGPAIGPRRNVKSYAASDFVCRTGPSAKYRIETDGLANLARSSSPGIRAGCIFEPPVSRLVAIPPDHCPAALTRVVFSHCRPRDSQGLGYLTTP